MILIIWLHWRWLYVVIEMRGVGDGRYAAVDVYAAVASYVEYKDAGGKDCRCNSAVALVTTG